MESNEKRILIADDESGITRLISAYLKRENFLIYTAADGLEAYEIYVDKKPDLLILDIMMPEINGLELVDIIRKNSFVPIILLTAKTDERDRIDGFRYGIDDYISKPFSPGELVERVKAVLRRSYPATTDEEQIIEYGPFILRFREHQILINDNILPTTKAQFDILSQFISSPGQVYTREQLYSILNLQESLDYSRSIDVQINNIRKIITQFHGSSNLIQTHRGIGYSLKSGLNK